MTKEEVIAMAREAGFMLRSESIDGESDWWECFDEEIESFARLVRNDVFNKHTYLWLTRIKGVVKAEREACAKVCDEIVARYRHAGDAPEMVAANWCAEWVGLTDEDIKEIIGPWGATPIKGYTRKLFDQIEAKLKEKNT